jgi:hypothetical protein
MDQEKKPAAPTAEERNEKVRKVLLAAPGPMGPTEIGRRIGESWCCYGNYGISAAITPVCRRIGATGEKGKWSLKAGGA